MSSFANPDAYFETDEEENCRDCDRPTHWTDHISWICPECHERECAP
jgi:hypothetical protein